MEKFRLPRKIKKRLKRKIYSYPLDKETNGYLIGFPSKSQEDYNAFKKGVLTPMLPSRKVLKERSRALFEKLDKELYVTDKELKKYIDEVIREDLRASYFNILSKAKNHPKAKKAYFNFINAYNLNMLNICCMTIDSAKKLLKN